MEASPAIAQEHSNRAGVVLVRACVGDDDVGIVIMVDVGNGNPPRAGSGRNGELTIVLIPRSRTACKKKQREFGYVTHVATAGKVNAQLAMPGRVRTEIFCQ